MWSIGQGCCAGWRAPTWPRRSIFGGSKATRTCGCWPRRRAARLHLQLSLGHPRRDPLHLPHVLAYFLGGKREVSHRLDVHSMGAAVYNPSDHGIGVTRRGGALMKPQARRRRRRTREQISYNMSRVRSTGSKIERVMENTLRRAELRPKKHPAMFGRPDFVFPRAKVAVFCDSHFWHGYDWKTKQKEIRSNRYFWVPKILSNMRRDRQVNRRLRKEGWTVLRFWEHQILRFPGRCAERVRRAITARRKKT